MSAEDNIRVFKRLYSGAKKPEDLPWDHTEPTHFLPAIVAGRSPGRALDLGCGTGVDSVYLASHGWEVTSLDFMPEAIAMTRRRAAGAGVRINLYRTDITIWSGDGRFDLIVDAGCLHSLRAGYWREHKAKLLDWLNPGGHFVLRHAERLNLLQWRPFGPRRVPRSTIVRRFAPEFAEKEFNRHIFTGVKFPWGPSFAHTTYWFEQQENNK